MTTGERRFAYGWQGLNAWTTIVVFGGIAVAIGYRIAVEQDLGMRLVLAVMAVAALGFVGFTIVAMRDRRAAGRALVVGEAALVVPGLTHWQRARDIPYAAMHEVRVMNVRRKVIEIRYDRGGAVQLQSVNFDPGDFDQAAALIQERAKR